jgi:hypothetical protein
LIFTAEIVAAAGRKPGQPPEGCLPVAKIKKKT